MSFRKRVRRFMHTLRQMLGIIGLGVVLVAIGLLLLERYHASDSIVAKLAGLFVSEMGFACLIAALIFAIMEEWAAREHCKTAIGYLYGVRPSGPFFKKIEQHVLEQHYYRDKVVVEYRFDRKEGENILVCFTLEYVVKNVCTRDDVEPLSVRGALTKKPLHVGKTAWDDELGVRSVTVGDKVHGRADLEIADDDSRQTETYRVKGLKPMPFKEPTKVKAVYGLVRHDHDSGAWSTTLPAVCAELRLTCGPGVRLKFVAQAIHPESDKLEEVKRPDGLTARLDEPFLAGHGFHFWWSPEAEEQAPREAVAMEA